MISAIDHIAIGVPDPDAAAAQLADQLGIAFTAGGRHPSFGTFNRLAFLGDTFLELIGVADPALATQGPVGAAALRAIGSGGGFATYALLDDAIETSVATLQAAGSSIGPVRHGSRERPDGEVVEFWAAFPERLGPDAPPFLIKHAYVGAEWGAAALAARRAATHPIGSPAILTRIDLATPDPTELAAEYFAQLGLEFWSVADLAVCSIGPHTIRLVPSREMEVPAAVVIGAGVESPRTIQALGMRFDVEPVVLPVLVS
ncbi:MAG TPA: VOC family protein [Candidatus Dormibacteraeota bacterium]|nr:VOC family protein [Candidatus Dormibacteraeota bacterium]